MFRFLRSLVNNEVMGEEIILKIQQLYKLTADISPAEDPHILLHKTYLSRMKARGFVVDQPNVQLKSLTETALISCLRKGDDIRALSLKILFEERPDIERAFPKFKANFENITVPLFEKIESGTDLKLIYFNKNPHRQVERLAPGVLEAFFLKFQHYEKPLERDNVIEEKESHEEEVSNWPIDSDEFYSANLLIEYSPDARTAWNAVQKLPATYHIEFLKTLSSNPKSNLSELLIDLERRYEKELRPYEDGDANAALGQARTISVEAEKEFLKVYDLLKDRELPKNMLAKIEQKFGPSAQSLDLIETKKVERVVRVEPARRAEKVYKQNPLPWRDIFAVGILIGCFVAFMWAAYSLWQFFS